MWEYRAIGDGPGRDRSGVSYECGAEARIVRGLFQMQPFFSGCVKRDEHSLTAGPSRFARGRWAWSAGECTGPRIGKGIPYFSRKFGANDATNSSVKRLYR